MRRLLLAAALVPGACASERPACGPSAAQVVRVIDGDTLLLDGGDTLRYLLVDAPESTGGQLDCFGAQATRFGRELLEGRSVTLAYDEAQCRDRYGRLLAYVSVGGREVNRLLVERGYACVLYIPPAGSDRRAELEALEAEARAAARGLWGACEEVPCE